MESARENQMKSIFSVLLFILSITTVVSSAFAGNLCDSSCDLTITFPDGGTLTATESLTFTFGDGGEINLGDTGTINAATQPASLDFPSGGSLTLDAGESITFDVGGFLNTAVAGNFDHTDITVSTDVEFDVVLDEGSTEAYLSDITATGDGSLSITSDGALTISSITADGFIIVNSSTDLTINGAVTILQDDGSIVTSDSLTTECSSTSTDDSGVTISSKNIQLRALASDIDVGCVNYLTAVGDFHPLVFDPLLIGSTTTPSTGAVTIGTFVLNSTDVSAVSALILTPIDNVEENVGTMVTGDATLIEASAITELLAPTMIQVYLDPSYDLTSMIGFGMIAYDDNECTIVDSSDCIADNGITYIYIGNVLVDKELLLSDGLSAFQGVTFIAKGDVLLNANDGDVLNAEDGIECVVANEYCVAEDRSVFRLDLNNMLVAVEDEQGNSVIGSFDSYTLLILSLYGVNILRRRSIKLY